MAALCVRLKLGRHGARFRFNKLRRASFGFRRWSSDTKSLSWRITTLCDKHKKKDLKKGSRI